MFYAYVQYTAIKDQTSFMFSFPLVDESELHVFKNNVKMVKGTHYTTPTEGAVKFNTPMLGGEKVVIRRVTDINLRTVNFTNTALLTEAELDTSAVQFFHALQEQADRLTLLGG